MTKKVLSEERKAAVETLIKRKWFKSTNEELRNELLDLPEDFDGFLKDLGDRPETIGNVEVQKMVELKRGNYLAIPIFEVRSTLTNETFTYEFASWKIGRNSGCKGIVLVEVDNEIKYFILKKANKFPVATDILEAIGTFYPKFSSGNVVSFSAKIENQLKSLLEQKELNVKRYIDLGTIYPDAGLSNESVTLFTAVMKVDDEGSLRNRFENKQYRSLRMAYDLEIQPIENLLQYVGKTDDAYFLSVVARLLSLNVIHF